MQHKQTEEIKFTKNISPEFVEEVIDELAKLNLPSDIYALAEQARKTREKNPDKTIIPFLPSHSVHHDPKYFPNYDGNFIEVAKMAVCAGPTILRDEQYYKYFKHASSDYYLQLEKFVSEVLLNKQVNHVIALGEVLEVVDFFKDRSRIDPVSPDFPYYFNDSRPYELGAKYKIASSLLSGIPLTPKENTSYAAHARPGDFSTFELTITQRTDTPTKEEDLVKKVTVSFYSIADGHSIVINEANANFFLDLYQVYLDSLLDETFMVAHCSLGAGRSAHLAAIFMFTRLMNEICENKTAKEAAATLATLITQMREDRSIAMPSRSQPANAFRAAVELHTRYQLRLAEKNAAEKQAEVSSDVASPDYENSTLLVFKGKKRMLAAEVRKSSADDTIVASEQKKPKKTTP